MSAEPFGRGMGLSCVEIHYCILYAGVNNEFNDALVAGRSDEIMGAIFDELVAYTETHFSVEEKLMASHDYEDLENHRREHRVFTDQIKMDRYNFNAGAWKYEKKMKDYLRGWLVNHIAASDRAYVPTLKRAGIE